VAFQQVQSSNLKAIDYSYITGTLSVQFKNGKQYEYANVSPATYAAFLAAPSAGSFFSSTIKGFYKFNEVPGIEG